MKHGILVPVDTLQIADEAILVARAVATPVDDGESSDNEALYVRFSLAKEALAMPLATIECAVASLGRLTRMPRRASRPITACFIEGRAVTVCDALDLVGGLPRDLELLSSAPAVVVAIDGKVRIAIAVEGPLDLVWASVGSHTSVSHAIGALGVCGSLADGALLLDGADLSRKALAFVGAPR